MGKEWSLLLEATSHNNDPLKGKGVVIDKRLTFPYLIYRLVSITNTKFKYHDERMIPFSLIYSFSKVYIKCTFDLLQILLTGLLLIKIVLKRRYCLLFIDHPHQHFHKKTNRYKLIDKCKHCMYILIVTFKYLLYCR